MNEEGFKTFLRRDKLSSKTIQNYVSYVKNFEKWLSRYRKKRLEDANVRNINDWILWAKKELKTIDPYFYSIRKYYLSNSNKEMVNAINEIINNQPSTRSKPLPSLPWTGFENVMANAEEISINDRDRALLNLLWSEMDSSEILELSISDINFENRYISSRISENKYHVTPEAWDALEQYVPIEDRGKNKSLFSIRLRRLQGITKKYFDEVKQTPKSVMLSCQKDLIDLGKQIRFVTEPNKTTIPKEMIETDPKPFDAYLQIEKILRLAVKEVKIIDPYVNKKLFPLYFYELPSNVNLKILTNNMYDKFKIVARKFKRQKRNFEVRKSTKFHDRYLIIDQRAWTIGQSIIDAGNKPLLIIEIRDVDTVTKMFEKLWNEASKVI